MIVNTQAIVLKYNKYSDASIIVHCLTEKLGRQSFLVYGIGKRKSNKLSQFQPLHLLDLQLYVKPNRSLQKLKESKVTYPLVSISLSPIKSTIALFISEVITKCVTEEYSDKNVFQFIQTSIQILEQLETQYDYFHHIFLLKLAKLLGILPEFSAPAKYIDITDGSNLSEPPHHDNFLDETLIQCWKILLNQNFESIQIPEIVQRKKSQILDSVVSLYEIHILNFNSLKSYPILKEVYR